MTMTIVGWALVIVGLGWFLYKLYVSYTSAGGTDFMMPVYDAAMYPPMMVAVGLYFALGSFEVAWPIWVYVLIWLGGTGVAAGTIKLAEEMGDKEL